MREDQIFRKVILGDFQSSSGPTDEWNEWYIEFCSYMKKILKDRVTDIKFSKNHFCLSGFLTTNDRKIFYFSVSDVRSPASNRCPHFLLRTAKSYQDFTGGCNNFLVFNNEFSENLIQRISGLQSMSKYDYNYSGSY